METAARERLRTARRVAVKVGTAVVTRPDGGLALGRLGSLVEQIAALRAEGREVVLVSSGALGLGAERLGFSERPLDVVDRQACAAAGQGTLMGLYDGFFARMKLACAQILLTEEDFREPARFVNVAATLSRLLALGAVPIVNENDPVSTAEIAVDRHGVFGDNDRLSALVAGAIDCDALVLLSDVDGVYTRPPGEPGAQRVPLIDSDELQELQLDGPSSTGRGGMRSKVASARVAARAGVTTVIATGATPDALHAALHREVGTLFPADERLDRRRQWLAFAAAPRGRLVVGAATRAALEGAGSLQGTHVAEVQGEFDAGAVVSVVEDGREFARGICRRSSAAARAHMADGAVWVERDDLVVLVRRSA